MQTLRLGSSGDDVKKWQFFLRGVGLYMGEVDGAFGPKTLAATQDFQRRHALTDDGVAGNRTLGVAMQLGFDAVPDDPTLPGTTDGPPPPAFSPLDLAGRQALFGKYDFTPAPTPENPEGIRILGDWESQNIQTFAIPQLTGKPLSSGKPDPHSSGNARFHRLVGPKVIQLFAAWEAQGLIGKLLTYQGSYVPRFIRGSRSVLSQHAFGSAFDINADWNGFGAVPAALGSKGSVRELVQTANEQGFYWGGHFAHRDGMHFEIARL